MKSSVNLISKRALRKRLIIFIYQPRVNYNADSVMEGFSS